MSYLVYILILDAILCLLFYKKRLITIAFRVDAELHRKLKAYIANNGISFSEYFISKIEADLNMEEQGISSQQAVREELRECVSVLGEQIQRMTSILDQQI